MITEDKWKNLRNRLFDVHMKMSLLSNKKDNKDYQGIIEQLEKEYLSLKKEIAHFKLEERKKEGINNDKYQGR